MNYEVKQYEVCGISSGGYRLLSVISDNVL